MNDTMKKAAIKAAPTVPIIRVTRDFAATPAQLFRAHTDPELIVGRVGPDGVALGTLNFEDLGDGRTRLRA